MKKLWYYLVNSNIKVCFDLNPVQWRFYWVRFSGPENDYGADSGLYLLSLKALMITITFFIDDARETRELQYDTKENYNIE